MLLTAYLINGQPVGEVVQSWSDSELNGNTPFKCEASASSGYQDISSITNWNKFGQNAGKDIKFIRNEIKLIREAAGYANLILSEQILTNKYFASGVEYNNAQVSVDEQNEFYFDFYKPNMDRSRRGRDIAVSNYIMQRLYTGVIPKVSVDALIKDAVTLRTEYLRDGLEGVGYGDDRDGVLNFVANTAGYAGFAIIGVNTVAKQFTVAGDKTSIMIADKKIRVYGSTGNDAIYTVVSSSFDNTNTIITVSEAVASSTADGSIYHNGLLSYADITSTIVSGIYDIYYYGNY